MKKKTNSNRWSEKMSLEKYIMTGTYQVDEWKLLLYEKANSSSCINFVEK